MDVEDPLVQQCQARVGLTIAGKWRLDGLVGVGGMAAVYCATHRNGAVAAIKILHPEFAGHQELRSRFMREAYIANKVDHPGTVKVLDDDLTEQGEPYLVMELLRGESLEARATRLGGRLPLTEALELVSQTLAVLECAHAAGIIHRDLKPDNLFLTSDGIVKLLDFGIARLREGADAKQTRTGLLMGTPAYMAPEQALGRWAEVDARTDLWAVAAILFSLLSGRVVHEAETANEMIIAAATRPAPSLARVVNAPIALVRLVDRGLEFEQAKRFADAATMRQAVLDVIATLGGSQPVVQALAPIDAGAAHAATVIGGLGAPAAHEPPRAQEAARGTLELARPAEPRRAEGVDAYDAEYASDADIARMTELFGLLEKTLVASVQYGADHPESARRRAHLFSQCASALMETDVALVWNITPYSFAARDQTLWEPRQPLDRIPYQLFADGVRVLGLLPGLSENEFFDLLALLTLDRARDVAPEDDFVTLLWDANFEHVAYQAIDNFAEGDQATRAQFEQRVDEVVRLAHFDTSLQLEESWQARQPADLGIEERQRRLLGALSTPERIDLAAVVQAESLGLVGEGDSKGIFDPARALRVDPNMLEVLAARMKVDADLVGERFVLAAASAYAEADARGSGTSVSAPIRSALDGLAAAAPAMAIEFIGALCRAIDRVADHDDVARLSGSLTGAVVSKRTMELIFGGTVNPGADQAVFARGLELILRHIDGTHVPSALRVLPNLSDPVIRDLVTAYLERAAVGYEDALGALFVEADMDLGLALVRVLAKLGTPAAKEAIAHASSSPHPVVRIEALGHVEGVSSERLRLELRALLEDREDEVRLAALRAMQRHGIRIAGPFLVLRIKSPVFAKLSYDERQQSLRTLVTLAPSRAEAVCLEILGESRMMASEAHEQSRELAADLLGEVATSREAVVALEGAAQKRWLGGSDLVRAAAERALGAIARRAEAQGAGRRP